MLETIGPMLRLTFLNLLTVGTKVGPTWVGQVGATLSAKPVWGL